MYEIAMRKGCLALLTSDFYSFQQRMENKEI